MGGQRRLLFLGTFVHSKTRESLEFLHDAALGVDSDGTIVGVESGSGSVEAAKVKLLAGLGWVEDEVEVCEARAGQFFFPGFIDTHIHASQYANAGVFGKSTLLDWLTTYTFPLEASLADLERARRVYSSCIRRTLSHGTTAAAYFATVDVAATQLLADLCLAMGQRALVGRVCMDWREMTPDDYRDETAEQGLERTRAVVAHCEAIDPARELVRAALTPRFVPSCSTASMAGLAALQRETGLPVQTHVAENAAEVAYVAARYPKSRSYAEVYAEHGLLAPTTILAHAVHLDEADAALLRDSGAKIAHCPCSNTSLASGAARVRWLWDRGLHVGLGTDVSGGYSASVLDAARQALMVSRHVAMATPAGQGSDRAKLSVEEVLHLATRGGAVVLGLGDRVGGFEVGKHWDAQLVGLHLVGPTGLDDDEDVEDEGNVDVFGWESWEDRMAKWLFCGDDRNTKSVWVRGRLVHSRR